MRLYTQGVLKISYWQDLHGLVQAILQSTSRYHMSKLES